MTGFDVLNQANNHSMDFGPRGRRETVAALQRAAVAETGLPGEVTDLNIRGVRMAFQSFAPCPYAPTCWRRARRSAALVVVMIHAALDPARSR